MLLLFSNRVTDLSSAWERAVHSVVLNFRVVLGQAYRGLTGGLLLLRIFSVAISVSPHVVFFFYLRFKFDFCVSKIMHLHCYELGIFHANQTAKHLRNHSRTKGEGWSTANKLKLPTE